MLKITKNILLKIREGVVTCHLWQPLDGLVRPGFQKFGELFAKKRLTAVHT